MKVRFINTNYNIDWIVNKLKELAKQFGVEIRNRGMKSVLISIQPNWVKKICSGEKTIEVRKTRPKIETPFKCYIYCTKGEILWLTQNGVKSKTELAGYLLNGKVIGEFVCDWITKITPRCYVKDFVNQYIHGYLAILGENDCLSFQEMKAYLGNKNGYDWHISDLRIYDKPILLEELGVTRPPLSWMFVEELK